MAGIRMASASIVSLVSGALLLGATSVIAGDASPQPRPDACPTRIPVADARAFFLGRGFVEREPGGDGLPWLADYDAMTPEDDPRRPPFMTVTVAGDDVVTALDLEGTLASDTMDGAWSVDDLDFAMDTWFDAGDAFVYEPDFPEPGYGRIMRSSLAWPTYAVRLDPDAGRETRWAVGIDGEGIHLELRIRGALVGGSWFGAPFLSAGTGPACMVTDSSATPPGVATR